MTKKGFLSEDILINQKLIKHLKFVLLIMIRIKKYEYIYIIYLQVLDFEFKSEFE